MPMYRTRFNTTVEARQMRKELVPDIMDWCGYMFPASIGDYVIKGKGGRFNFCPEADFDQKFTPVE